MKIKLLKKLREEARKQYRVVASANSGYRLETLVHYELGFEAYEIYDCYEKFHDAVIELKELRKTYILDRIDLLRKKYKKERIIDAN